MKEKSFLCVFLKNVAVIFKACMSLENKEIGFLFDIHHFKITCLWDAKLLED